NYRDITERKTAEAEIQKLAAFPLYSPNPVLELSADGTLTYFNDAAQQAARLLGKNHPREILPSGVKEIIKVCLGAGKSTTGAEADFQRGRARGESDPATADLQPPAGDAAENPRFERSRWQRHKGAEPPPGRAGYAAMQLRGEPAAGLG